MHYIEVVNLDKHQHYKTRNIHAWIKLDCSMLTGESMYNLCEIDRWRFIALIMLAISRSNRVKHNDGWLEAVITRAEEPSNRAMKNTLEALLRAKLIKIIEEEPTQQPTQFNPRILPTKINNIIKGG